MLNNIKNKTPVDIVDAYGKPLSLSFNYDFLNDTKSRKIYSGYNTVPVPESVSYNQKERLKVISFLRRSFRDNPLTSAVVYKFASSVGAPVYQSIEKSISGKKGEDLIYKQTKNLCYGKSDFGWDTFNQVIYTELCLAGEVFLVKTNGKLQLIPSDVVGSPDKDKPENEDNGLCYNEDGSLKYIRVGKYITKRNYSQLSFELNDSKIIDAEYLYHMRCTSRIDEQHGMPLLVPAIKSIVDLYETIQSKNTSIKNGAIFSAFLTKNIDPAVYTKMLESTGDVQYLNDMMLSQSRYSSFQNGTLLVGEPGEGIETINNPYNSNDFNEYVDGRIKEICSVLQMPSEYITGWSKASFSSNKMSAMAFQDFLDRYRNRSEPFYNWVKDFIFDVNDFVDENEYALIWKKLPVADEIRQAQKDLIYLNAGLVSKEQVLKDSSYWVEDLDKKIVDETASKIKSITDKAKELNVTVEFFVSMMPAGGGLAQTINNISKE